MAIPHALASSAGKYKGRSKLHLSWLPESEREKECDSELTITIDRHATHAQIRYVWEEDGAKQDGTMIVCGDLSSGETQVAWSDSWHQSTGVMFMQGKCMSANVVDVLGSYKVEGHPDWGWRMELSMNGPNFVLKMFNRTPDGEEEWAVEAEYLPV